MALLHLAREAYPGRVVALTVDHRLRAGSAQEAIQVGDWCKGLGIPHRILRWEGAKPATGLQRHAREARYRLLAEAAAQLGEKGLAAPLVVAHTLDDQAETFLLRLAHGSDVGGLGAMRAATEIASVPPVPLLRPLLASTRARLRATLHACGQGWVDDPSNDDVRFERVRLRRAVPLLESSGVSREGLARASALMARIDGSLLEATRSACPYRIDPDGSAAFGARAFADLADQAAARYLSHLVRLVGGEPYPPARVSLLALGAKMREAAPRGSTLGGCVVRLLKETWVIAREPRAAARTQVRNLPNGGITLWDHRFWVSVPAALGAVTIGARGALPALLQQAKGPVRDLLIVENVSAFRELRDQPVALFVGEVRMSGGMSALWRQVMKDTSQMEYDTATVS